MKQKLTSLIDSATVFVVILFTSTLLPGCAHLDPNANALIVRAEQAESLALSNFDLILNVDNSNRQFFKTNAPGFHVFAEYLRAPVTIGTNTYPRSIAMIHSLQDVKTQYKLSNGKSGDLQTALATFQAVVDQAKAWNDIVNPPNPNLTN